MSLGIRIASSLFVAAIATACASGGSGGTADSTGTGGAGAAGGAAGSGGSGTAGSGTAGSGTGTAGTGSAGFGVGGGAGAGAGPQGKPLVYVHSNTTLFQMDPTMTPYSLQMIGDFDCIGTGTGQDTSMTDFAVDSAGNLFAVSATHAYVLEVQGTTVHCKSTIQLPSTGPSGKPVKFFALSIAPPGVITDGKEVLVAGNTEGELWAIDDQGQITQHGNFGPVPKKDQNGYTFPNSGQAWELSGDIVFLANGGTPVGFATVRDCPKPPSTSSCNSDTLIEINVGAMKTATTGSVLQAVRGKIQKAATCTDSTTAAYGNMYGIAAWNDQIFGFSNKGEFVTISNKDGSACLIQTFATQKWAGAGVTTIAPVVAPPPVPGLAASPPQRGRLP